MTLSPPNNTIIFEKQGKGRTNTKSFFIRNLQEHFKSEIPYLMFIHAVGGCDMTSSIFLQGKLKHFKTIKNHPELYDSLLLFNNEFSLPEDLIRAGEEFFLKLYKAPSHIKSLDKYRYHVFQKTVASSKKQVQLARLPPTLDAAKQHLYRVYLQIQTWRGKKINPINWGWEEYNGTLSPVFTKKSPAPDTLLNIISLHALKRVNKIAAVIKQECDVQLCANIVLEDHV